jgi:hypothetical protein
LLADGHILQIIYLRSVFKEVNAPEIDNHRLLSLGVGMYIPILKLAAASHYAYNVLFLATVCDEML